MKFQEPHLDTVIGINAEYGWDEETQMACALADNLARFSLAVSFLATRRYLAPGGKKADIHHAWDTEVCVAKDDRGFEQWLHHVSCVVWFGISPRKLARSRLAACRNILMYKPHRLTPEDYKCLALFDVIVAPTPLTIPPKDLLAADTHEKLSIYWDSGLPLVHKRVRTYNDKTVRVFVPISARVMDSSYMLITRVLRRVITKFPHLRFTLAPAKSWNKEQQVQIDRLLKTEQVMNAPGLSCMQRMEAYRVHDWALCLDPSPDSGQAPVEALSHGRPVICYDIPIYNEHVEHCKHGVLLPCEVSYDWQGLAVAEPREGRLISQLEEIFSDDTIRSRLAAKPWPDLELRRRASNDSWKRILDVP